MQDFHLGLIACIPFTLVVWASLSGGCMAACRESFRDALTHLRGAWMIVNAWDLVAMDWPYVYLTDPGRPPIPGTRGARGYKDYGFHFRAFLKASVLGLVVVVPVAFVISLLPGG